jgi:hypothetical protein
MVSNVMGKVTDPDFWKTRDMKDWRADDYASAGRTAYNVADIAIKCAAEAVYPVSDDSEDEEDDKGWGAKEWLTLALASGGLAAGLGAAYVYRKEIDKALGGRIFGDSREKMSAWLQDNTPTGTGAFGLGAGLGVLHGTVPALKKLPGGPDHGIQTTGGLINKLNQGGEAAEPHLRAMGTAAGLEGDKGPRAPLEAGNAVHTFAAGSMVNPSHPLAILNNKDLFDNKELVNAVNQGTAKGPMTPDPSKQSILKRVFGNNSDPNLAIQQANAEKLVGFADSGQRKLDFNANTPDITKHQALSAQEQAAHRLREGFTSGLGSRVVNIVGVPHGIAGAQRISTKPTLGGVAARALGYGFMGSGASMLGEKIWGK